jgi:hypothetical protein
MEAHVPSPFVLLQRSSLSLGMEAGSEKMAVRQAVASVLQCEVAFMQRNNNASIPAKIEPYLDD